MAPAWYTSRPGPSQGGRTGPRTAYDIHFKSKVAVEAIRGEKTVAQIASGFGIHPNLVTQWAREALGGRGPVSRISVAMRSLDSLRDELAIIPDRTFLKLDVQGAELRVLAGAGSMLAGIPAVQAEMAITPSYIGQPAFADVLNYLRAQGFYLHHLYNGWKDPSTGELYETDGLFLSYRAFGLRPCAVGEPAPTGVSQVTGARPQPDQP